MPQIQIYHKTVQIPVISSQFSCYYTLCLFHYLQDIWIISGLMGAIALPTYTNLFNILCFSCQGKSRDIVYQRTCLLLCFIFAQHGLFEIQLTVYSAVLRLTDPGIYYITRCGI